MLSSQRLWPWSWSVLVAFMRFISEGMAKDCDPDDRCPPETVAGSRTTANRAGDERFGPVHERIEMRRAAEAFRVNLVNVLGAGRSCREPSARGHDLQATDRRVVAGSVGQLGRDPLSGERRFLDVVG